VQSDYKILHEELNANTPLTETWKKPSNPDAIKHLYASITNSLLTTSDAWWNLVFDINEHYFPCITSIPEIPSSRIVYPTLSPRCAKAEGLRREEERATQIQEEKDKELEVQKEKESEAELKMSKEWEVSQEERDMERDVDNQETEYEIGEMDVFGK
jgi:hypothetical protein